MLAWCVPEAHQRLDLFLRRGLHALADLKNPSNLNLWRATSAHRSLGKDPRNHQRGFTVIELLIVVSVLLTVAAIAIPNLINSLEQARVARAVSEIKMLEDEISLYYTIYYQFPDDLSQVGYPNFLDPWGHPYQYFNHATMKGNGQARKDRFLVPLNSDYDLYSMGHDGQSVPPITASKSQDDVIRASDGSYVGLASQF